MLITALTKSVIVFLLRQYFGQPKFKMNQAEIKLGTRPKENQKTQKLDPTQPYLLLLLCESYERYMQQKKEGLVY